VCSSDLQEATGQFVQNLKQDRKTQVDRFSDHVRKTYRNERRLTKAWKNHVALEYAGLSVVPRPFYVKTARFRSRGFVAMEDLGSRGEEISRFIDRNYDGMSDGDVRRFIGRFSTFLVSLLRRGIAHRDMKATNVFILDDGTFRLLDVEDILFESPVGTDRLATMFVQLNKSVPRRISDGYRLRFLSTVAQGGGLTKDERRGLLKQVRERSLADVVAYAGVSGLVTEKWS
jgi:hypothetical protein